MMCRLFAGLLIHAPLLREFDYYIRVDGGDSWWVDEERGHDTRHDEIVGRMGRQPGPLPKASGENFCSECFLYRRVES
jgi:hypothetical protein